jgi:hypothetical protein
MVRHVEGLEEAGFLQANNELGLVASRIGPRAIEIQHFAREGTGGASERAFFVMLAGYQPMTKSSASAPSPRWPQIWNDRFQRCSQGRLSDTALVRTVNQRAAAVGLDPDCYALPSDATRGRKGREDVGARAGERHRSRSGWAKPWISEQEGCDAKAEWHGELASARQSRRVTSNTSMTPSASACRRASRTSWASKTCCP